SVVTLAAHIVHQRNVYLLAGLAPADQFRSVQEEFTQTIRSFKELSRQEAENIRPNRVDLYTVRTGDTWSSIADLFCRGTLKASPPAIMNNYEPTQPPMPGDRIKVIVEG